MIYFTVGYMYKKAILVNEVLLIGIQTETDRDTDRTNNRKKSRNME